MNLDDVRKYENHQQQETNKRVLSGMDEDANEHGAAAFTP